MWHGFSESESRTLGSDILFVSKQHSLGWASAVQIRAKLQHICSNFVRLLSVVRENWPQLYPPIRLRLQMRYSETAWSLILLMHGNGSGTMFTCMTHAIGNPRLKFVRCIYLCRQFCRGHTLIQFQHAVDRHDVSERLPSGADRYRTCEISWRTH